jgi:hypothetical protein
MPDSVSRQQLPDRLAAVALVNGKIAAATGGQSLSQWLQDVADGKAPQPVIRENRFTRWRLVDVEAYWSSRAATGLNPQAAQAVVERARKGCAARHSRAA